MARAWGRKVEVFNIACMWGDNASMRMAGTYSNWHKWGSAFRLRRAEGLSARMCNG